jgi:hypothetical protein
MKGNSFFRKRVLYVLLSAIIGIALFFLNAYFVYGMRVYNEKTGYFISIFMLLISGFTGTAISLLNIYNQFRNYTKLKDILKILFIFSPLLFLNLIIIYVSIIFIGVM